MLAIIGNFVADTGNCRVADLDANGNYERSIGREGSGPGEFRSVDIRLLQGEILTIWDYSQLRSIQYRINGELLSTNTPQDRLQSDGYYIDEGGRGYRFYRLDSSMASRDFSGYGVTIVDVDGDTLADLKTPPLKVLFRIQNPDGSSVGYWIPYSGVPVVYHSNNNQILVSTGNLPEIDVYSMEGELTRRIRIDGEPGGISREEAGDIFEGIRLRLASADNDSAERNYRLLLENLVIPEKKGFVEDLFVDTAGLIWVQYPIERLSDNEEIRRFRIIGPDGEYLGDTTVPAYRGQVMQGKLLGWIPNPDTGGRDAVVFSIQSNMPGFMYSSH